MTRGRRHEQKMNYNTEGTPEPGAYMIYEKGSGKTYIGATNNLHTRLRAHECNLRNGTHYNPNLQEVYNKTDGGLEVILCPTGTKEIALDVEQSVLDTYLESGLLLNISDNSTSHIDYEHVARRVSEARKGMVFSEDHKKALSLAKQNPVTVDGKTYHNYRVAMRELNVTRATVKHMAGIKQPLRSRISIDGVEYDSLREAQDKLGITKSSLMFKLNSDAEKHSGYVRLTRSCQDKRT